MAVNPSHSQNHTDLHTYTGTKHQRDPRRSHPDRDPRNHKPATATAITEITHPNRPTDARLGVPQGLRINVETLFGLKSQLLGQENRC